MSSHEHQSRHSEGSLRDEEAILPTPIESPSEATEFRVRELEAEIASLRLQLRATVENYETLTEELRASNEELQTINEELRQATEELEVSEEELESSHQESEGLARANSDLQNLLTSTEIGTIFLNRQLRIQRFTPRMQDLYNLIPTDVGRSLSDITHKLNHDGFSEDAERVLRNLTTIEHEVSNNTGQTFLARLLPYRTIDDKIDGVVLTFVDITARKQAEEALQRMHRELETRVQERTGELAASNEALQAQIVERTQAEAALRQSEERFRSVSDSGIINIAFFDANGVITDANDAFLEMVGYSREDLQTGAVRWEGLTPPEWMPRTRQALNEFQATGCISPYEKEYFRRDGSRFWGLFGGARLQETQEGVAFVLDVTERKQIEDTLVQKSAHLQLLSDVAAQLLSVDDVDQFVDSIYQRLSTLIELAAYFHYRAIPSRPDTMQLAAYSGIDERTAEKIEYLRYGETVCGTVVQQQTPAIIESVQQSHDPKTQLIRTLGITAYACFPLVTPSSVYGTISFARQGQDHFTPDELSLLRSVSTLIATALERRQAERALRDSEERYRRIVEMADEGIWAINSQARTTYVNRRMAEMLGCSVGEIVGRSAFEFVAPEDWDEAEREWVRRRQGTGRRLELRLRRKDGSYLWIYGHVTPLFGENSPHLIGAFGMFADITARKQAEADRQRLMERLVTAQEEERSRIARELHDQMGQHLTLKSPARRKRPHASASCRSKQPRSPGKCAISHGSYVLLNWKFAAYTLSCRTIWKSGRNAATLRWTFTVEISMVRAPWHHTWRSPSIVSCRRR
jgi:PAS domain S-box-containing protein